MLCQDISRPDCILSVAALGLRVSSSGLMDTMRGK